MPNATRPRGERGTRGRQRNYFIKRDGKRGGARRKVGRGGAGGARGGEPRFCIVGIMGANATTRVVVDRKFWFMAHTYMCLPSSMIVCAKIVGVVALLKTIGLKG